MRFTDKFSLIIKKNRNMFSIFIVTFFLTPLNDPESYIYAWFSLANSMSAGWLIGEYLFFNVRNKKNDDN